MIHSMTGFGRHELEVSGMNITIEARSVNSRYLDINFRIPEALSEFENDFRKIVQDKFDRGQISIKIALNGAEDKWTNLSVDRELLENYQRLIKEIQSTLSISKSPTMSDYLNLPDLFKYEQELPEDENLLENVIDALDEALIGVQRMRKQEGESLAIDMNSRLTTLENALTQIEKNAADNRQLAKQNLENRIQELLGDMAVDQDKLAQETAYIADKVDITEETVRIRSHIQQFHTLLKNGRSVGKKMNFLLQEMNREVNTMGAKANHAGISHLVVDCKNEIEKLREQVQNIE